MPELPEVETIVRELAPRLINQRIVVVEILHPRATRHSLHDVAEHCAGQKINAVSRSGKFIEIVLENGFLTLHLGMTGQLRFDVPLSRHTRAVFQLESSALVFDDMRTFGSIEWSAVRQRTAHLGPEPFALAPSEFYSSIAQRAAPIKALLLNQRILRGVGNIYADEALFRAGIRPGKRGLSKPRSARLLAAVQEVLTEAILHRGSSVSDYMDINGRSGAFQDRHNVYGREGLPCRKCGRLITKVVLAQRGTHFCATCQK